MRRVLKLPIVVMLVSLLVASILCAAAIRASAAPIVSRDGWGWQNPLPQGNNVYDIWGSSSSDVFAAVGCGIILHYDGFAWDAMSSGTTNDLNGVWGSSPSSVFAVGALGTILHYDGTAWGAMISGTTNDLNGVWGSSSSDVFAVGRNGTILHCDGTAWSAMTSGTTNHLLGIWGSSSDDVFAVGMEGIVLHYDGSVWSTMNSSTSNWLEAVWGTSSSDVFAVGWNGTILHYDGTSWSGMTGATDSLHGVWGTSSSDVFAMGLNDTVMHYNGTAWSATTSGTATVFHCIWGSSSSDLFAAGGYGVILHYNGVEWSATTTGTTSSLRGIWGSSSSDVFAVGGTIIRYDGSSWNTMTSPAWGWVTGVWGSSSSDVFAVGSDGMVIHYDGTTWSSMSSGTTAMLWGIWGSSSSDVFAVGLNGTIIHYDGATWSAMGSETTDMLKDVWGSSSSNVFAVGAGGTILHYDGFSWSSLTAGTTNDLCCIWGSSSSDIFVAGWYGIILHYDGENWSATNSGIIGSLEDVWGSSSSDVFAVGVGGSILHYDGSSWSAMDGGNYHGLFGVWGSSSSDVFVVGSGGNILHYPDEAVPSVTTGNASQITTESARLNGNLTSPGTAASVMVSFIWGTNSGTYPNETAGQVMTVSGGFFIDLGSLTPGTTYYYKAKAVGDGTSYGAEKSFTTTSATPPTVATIDASDISTVSARLNGDLTALGTAGSVTVSFLWGTSSGSYLWETLGQAITGTGDFYFDLGSLTPGTTYYYKAKAVGDGTGYGAEKSFTTTSANTPPVVTSNAATSIGTSSATLNGDLTSLGTADNVWVSFEWGLTDSYGNTTALQGPMWAPGAWSYPLSGLTPGTTYHFRAKADGGDGTAYGSDMTFTTLSTAGPSVTTNAATSIGTSSATLNGDLASLGTADNVWVCFEWGLTDGYGDTTALQGPMWAPDTWSHPLSGLTPGTTYHFRAKADSGDGTAYGSDMTFTTGQTPEIENVNPDNGERNQDLTVIISGSHLDGATAVSFGSGIAVEDFTVNGSTGITAEITIDADATVGYRDVSVTTEWGTVTKTDAFSVVGGGGGICGAGAPTMPNHGSEMMTILAALGLLSGVAYLLVTRGVKNRRHRVRA